MRHAAWIALTLSLLGCGGAVAPAAGGRASVGELASWRTADDALAKRMRGLGERMEAAGLVVAEIEGRGFLASRGASNTSLWIPAGRCFTIVAIASRGVRDIDATLYTPDGDVLAEDAQPDAHPTMQVCGGATGRRLYYHLQVYDGAGAYLFASFEGDRTSFGPAARVVGGRPGVASDTIAGAPEEDERLHEFAGGASRRGFDPVGEPEAFPLAPDQRVRVPLPAEAAHCYTAAAFSDERLEDVDLRVFDDLGREVARDVSPRADAAVQFCTPRDGDYAVEVHARRGAGEASLAMFSGPASTVGGASGLWLGERVEALASRAPLEERLRAEDARADDEGYGAGATVAGGRLLPAEATRHRAVLSAGRCARIVALGGAGVTALTLRVRSVDGQALAAGQGAAGRTALHVCPAERTAVTVDVVAHAGSGSYAVRLFDKPVPSELPKDAAPLSRGPLLAALEDARRGSWTLEGAIETLAPPVTIALGHAPASACTWLVAVSKGGADDVVLRLVKGERVREKASGRRAELMRCGGARDGARVVLDAGGEVFLLRFAKER